MTSQQFIYKLSSILEHNAVPKKREKEKSGKINSSRLGKFGTTNRLFMRRSEEKKEKEYSISILVDASGSMNNNMPDGRRRCELAVETVTTIAHCFDRVTGLDYEITIFNGMSMQAKGYGEKFNEKLFAEIYNTCKRGRHEGWVNYNTGDIVDTIHPTSLEERKELESSGYQNLRFIRENDGENYDGLAVHRLYKRLAPRTGKKVIMTFSDGQPTDGTLSGYAQDSRLTTLRKDKTALKIITDSPQLSLRKAIHVPKREGVEIIGIGIDSTAVELFYNYHAVIRNSKDFLPKTLSALSRIFRKV